MARFCHNNIGTLLPLLITLFIIATSVPVAQSLSTAPTAHSTNSGRKCGGAAECGGGGEEFLMDSQTATWLLSSLQGNTQNTISYKGLKRPPVCDAKRSGSCLADKVNGGNSKCDYHNRSCVR
nr:protein RALF-like 27 [Ipomoea batatas]GME20737.1 protein RALF-like 27 [Ipomoea batatas]